MAGIVIALLIAGQAAPAPQAGSAVRTIARGADSHVSVHREIVVRTAGWWQFIWHEHTGSFTPPQIDFSRAMVVAVFAGKTPAGTSIEITRVTQDGPVTTVYYRELRTTTVAGDRTVGIAPFHIIVVPAGRSTVTFVNLTGS